MSKLDSKTGGMRSVNAAPRAPTQTAQERRYRAEEDLSTARRYHEMASDPERMRDVGKLATEQMQHLAKVADHAQPKKSGTPSSASRGGSSGGGSAREGPRSGKKVR